MLRLLLLRSIDPHFGPHGNLAGCLSLPLFLSPSQEASYCFSTAHRNMNHSKSVHLETGNTFEAQGLRGFLLSAFTMYFSRNPQTLNRPWEVVNHPSLQSLWIPGTTEHHWQWVSHELTLMQDGQLVATEPNFGSHLSVSTIWDSGINRLGSKYLHPWSYHAEPYFIWSFYWDMSHYVGQAGLGFAIFFSLTKNALQSFWLTHPIAVMNQQTWLRSL